MAKKSGVNINIYKRDKLWHISLSRKDKYGNEVIVIPEINLYRKPYIRWNGQEASPLEQGKDALIFLKWLIREIEAEYPAAKSVLNELKLALLSIDGFVNLRDDKKILKRRGG